MPIPSSLRRTAARLLPGVAARIRHRRRLAAAVVDTQTRVGQLQASLDALRSEVNAATLESDGRLAVLRTLVSRVEPYQPLYGIGGIIDQPARTSADRARAIESAMSGVRGKRILDVGASFGYMSYYFADRAAVVTGWEANPQNTEVARQVGAVNGLRATFLTKELNLENARTIEPGSFDCAFVLAVFHHIIHFQGLEAAQQIMAELIDRIPVVFLELAARGEDADLFWDAAQPEDPLTLLDLVRDRVQIDCLGVFDTHLSDRQRPLYRVSRPKVVEVDGHDYAYDTASSEAYHNSPIADGPWRRVYYHSATHVIKEYVFGNDETDNWRQILGELYVHTVLDRGKPVHHALHVDDVHLDRQRARVAIRRVPGELLSDVAPLAPDRLRTVVADVLTTLADLHDRGFHHNDVRSWNIVVNDEGGWLIDYGRAAHDVFEDDAVALAWAVVAGARGGREPATEPKAGLPDLSPLDGTTLAGFADALRAGERDPRALLASL